jgi:mannose-1-phosphate guanylyltransferase
MYAVIMAGGKGARFWPRSTEARPKHLLDILSEKTILQETVERISPIVSEDKIIVVTNQIHAQEVKKQLPHLLSKNIITEPVGRNTAPCIGLAALHVMRDDPGNVMVVMPSDHFIGNRTEFERVIADAVEVAEKESALVTIGIKPSRPDTGYGYLERGEAVAEITNSATYKVLSFREKPGLKEAENYLKTANFFWNSGIFIWQASKIMSAIEVYMPELYKGLQEINRGICCEHEDIIKKKVYEQIQPVSIDYGVLEKSSNVLMIEGDFNWSDVGSWDALWEILDKDVNGNVTRGNVISVNSRNSFVIGSKKLVAIIDAEDLIVVETDDGVLICKRGSSQHVKKIVETLAARKESSFIG